MKITKFILINDIIILSLQRFERINSLNKNESVLDLKPFCDESLIKCNLKYKLLALINHIGNIDRRHYFSYIKIKNIWYNFNDIL